MKQTKKRELSYSDHRRKWGQYRYVYPVMSRRSGGLSLGVNLNPDRICNFACPYCQVVRDPSKADKIDVDLQILTDELTAIVDLILTGEIWGVAPLDSLEPSGRVVADIAFSGDGEAASCPLFAKAISMATEQAARLDGVEVVLITNATLLMRPAVSDAVDDLCVAGGVVWAKLDAGTNEWFQRVCGTSMELSKIVENISATARRWPVVIQAMFLADNGAGPSGHEIDAWVGQLKKIRDTGGAISKVQVYTIARTPDDLGMTKLPVERLVEIADAARAAGFVAEVYP